MGSDADRRLQGSAELTIHPTHNKLTTVRINCRQLGKLPRLFMAPTFPPLIPFPSVKRRHSHHRQWPTRPTCVLRSRLRTQLGREFDDRPSSRLQKQIPYRLTRSRRGRTSRFHTRRLYSAGPSPSVSTFFVLTLAVPLFARCPSQKHAY